MLNSSFSLPSNLSASALERWLASEESASIGAKWVGLKPLEKALVVTALSQRDDRPIVVIFGTQREAREFLDHLGFWNGRQANDRSHYLPAPELDFYRGILPNPELLCERNIALHHALSDPKGRIWVTTAATLLQKAIPSREFSEHTLRLKPNEEIERGKLIAALVAAGYQRQPACTDPGIYAVRGGVVDVFSPIYRQPVRIEFYGDFVDEIRFFDPRSQRSLEKLEEVALVPVGLSLIPAADRLEVAAQRLKVRLDDIGITRPARDEILDKLRDGQLPSELQFLYPLLSGGSRSLADYFPGATHFVWDGRAKLREEALGEGRAVLQKHVDLFAKAPSPIASFEELVVNESEWDAFSEGARSSSFEDFAERENEATLLSEPVSLARERETAFHKSQGTPSLEAFARRFRQWMEEGYRVQIVSHTVTHSERVQALFEAYGLRSTLQSDGRAAFPTILSTDFSVLNLWQGFLSQSLVFPMLRLVLVSEEEIFGQKKRSSRNAQWKSTHPTELISSFRDLKPGDFVVHRDHGIGKYLGLKSMSLQGLPNDFVHLEYKDGDKLYVPVYRLNVLQKYSGAESGEVATDKLGGDRWSKAKKKAEKAVAELAAELLAIQAKRRLMPGFAFSAPSNDFKEFEMTFPYDETPDQAKAIESVMDDLSRPHPMDRLVCGDVGYGKTEVALRAAYRAVLDKKQVAFLVPTTVLAFQHYETCRGRMKDFAVNVEMVSRLRTSTETKRVLDDLRAGKVDIIVGTHRLLSTDVSFPRLGLVVIDEEHRFGVVHKERLKKLAESVHVLTMTATPIPRTLNMAMVGIKDISIITTPPPDRLAVRTFVCRESDEVLKEAISNELNRDGQIFFVHNRIESIFAVADNLKKLFPKLKFEIVHGQMEGDELEKKMLAFYRGEFHLLLTTTIIESGLDIPRANTIIIDEADHLGLAQIYQLRGRVGRSDRRAYCYLLVPPQMTEDAKQRLQVIQRYTDLGAGFSVASHDLEIRGAGDLLGQSQSGHITAVGVDLYFELLEESIRELRGGEKGIEIEPEITLKVAAFFPESYLPDIAERIQWYRRLSSVETEETISEIEEEIRDRFGTLPGEVVNLLGIMKLKFHLKKLHVLRMSSGPKRTSLQFAPSTPASPEHLVKLVQSDPKRYSVTPDQKLVFEAPETDWKSLLREVQRLSHSLGVA